MGDTFEKGVLGCRIDNIFREYGYEKFLTWDDLINHLKEQGETDILSINQTLQGLIDTRNVCYEKGRGYALSTNLAGIKAKDEWRSAHAGKIMSRLAFDSMTPQQQMDFINKGGVIE